MKIKYGKEKNRQNNVLYTILVSVLIFLILLSMVSYIYIDAENEACEMLHTQTKQIKDDLILQIKSDRENLSTMSYFAAELYKNGESYDRMFDAFKPIGLFSNIGILGPDNVFHTKKGSVDLSDKISYVDELRRGEYISGRIPDLTRDGEEIIRSAVPIKVDGKYVGILYGVIKLDVISEKYNHMAQELDAQLFVYDKENGNYVINTIEGTKGNISSLKSRTYNDGYTYEELVSEPNGFSSFKSIRNGQDLYVHYSTIEDLGWRIMLARYESQVFEKADGMLKVLLVSFFVIFLLILAYVFYLIKSEKRRSMVISYASETRKELLDAKQTGENIIDALKNLAELSVSRSAFVVDADCEEYFYVAPGNEKDILYNDDRNAFVLGVFRYVAGYYRANKKSIGQLRIKCDGRMLKASKAFYELMLTHKIKEIVFSYVVEKNNHTSILGIINPKRKDMAASLLENVMVCFSIALFNKKHLSKTEAAAITDSLTGAYNRVAYKKDILKFDEEKPDDFSCIYIDVNELHLRNNKYGHAAGDEMLIYIANTLKDIFYGHNIYRVGGDEFLLFVKNTGQNQVIAEITALREQLKVAGYNVAVGMSFRKKNISCDEMIREAEVRMYEDKTKYYQDKEMNNTDAESEGKYLQINTGIREIDTMLSVLKEHYNGIYRVSLLTDTAHRILMPAYLEYNEDEKYFSRLLVKYIDNVVHSDFHRPFTNFLNYEGIIKEIKEGIIPKMTYKKINGEKVILSIYNLEKGANDVDETLWVFAKA